MKISNIRTVYNRTDPEFRMAIHGAWANCDGTSEGLRMELESLTTEYPELPVNDIMELVQ